MKIINTPLNGLKILELEPRTDERGYFVRTFCGDELRVSDLDFKVKQINHSFTKLTGTLRGMHFQREPKAEGKIVQCLRGKIYDVTLDLRPESSTYLKWFPVELSEGKQILFYIPKGFAHGLQTLTDNCLVQYFMSETYSPEHVAGVRWDDPALAIKWPIAKPILAEKDKNWPLLI